MTPADHRLHMARKLEALARDLASEARGIAEVDGVEVHDTLTALYGEAKRLRDNRARVLAHQEPITRAALIARGLIRPAERVR